MKTDNNENEKKCPVRMIGKWVPALLIAVGLMLLGIFISQGFGRLSQNSRVVTVRGLSEREVQANKVTWPIVSKIVGNDLTDLYRQVSTIDGSITAFLERNGVSETEYSVNAPQVQDLSLIHI